MFAVPRCLEKARQNAPPQARVTAKGPDGKSEVLPVDLLNDTYDGPRAGVPAEIWKVVALAATTAGDIGITYATPDPRPM